MIRAPAAAAKNIRIAAAETSNKSGAVKAALDSVRKHVSAARCTAEKRIKMPHRHKKRLVRQKNKIQRDVIKCWNMNSSGWICRDLKKALMI